MQVRQFCATQLNRASNTQRTVMEPMSENTITVVQGHATRLWVSPILIMAELKAETSKGGNVMSTRNMKRELATKTVEYINGLGKKEVFANWSSLATGQALVVVARRGIIDVFELKGKDKSIQIVVACAIAFADS
jgi:hypothetical protein